MLDWLSSNAVAIAAILISGAAFLNSRKATKASQEAADGATRSAAVAERQEQRHAAESDRAAVTWTIDCTWPAKTGPLAGESILAIRATNDGSAIARDVHIEPPSGAQIVNGVESMTLVEPGHFILLESVPPPSADGTSCLLTWAVVEGGERYVRWFTIPPRPEKPFAYFA